jgi:uncharacterized protein YdhG (YjbR/CyaY superfamily)
MAKTDFKSVSDYITSKPKDVQVLLKRVRAAIRKALPEAEEGISYQIPTYMLNSVPVLYFAGRKEHFSLYPATDALIAGFKQELASYEISKGTVRFPYSEPVPVELIERIAKFRAEQLVQQDKRRGRKGGRESQLDRVRRICDSMPSAFEKVSHGAPTFFVEKYKNVFTMFADNHHQDGHLAVWVPAPPGLQAALIEEAPETYFKPPYVGVGGWIGINLDQIGDEALQIHIRKAWELSSPRKKDHRQRRSAQGS